MHPSKGIRQQIAEAASVGMIEQLLRVGAQYQQASPRTKRSWQVTAARRLHELTAKKPAH